MNNEQKAQLYHSLLLRHDKLDGQISDIKSDAAGSDLNDVQKDKVSTEKEEKETTVKESKEMDQKKQEFLAAMGATTTKTKFSMSWSSVRHLTTCRRLRKACPVRNYLSGKRFADY